MPSLPSLFYKLNSLEKKGLYAGSLTGENTQKKRTGSASEELGHCTGKSLRT